MSRGQRTCVVADMFTHIPIGNVKVIDQGYTWAGALESSIVSHFSVDRKWNVEVDYLDLVANRDSSFMHHEAVRLMNEHDANRI